MGLHPRVVQSTLLHKRNPLHADDELRRNSNCRLLRQHLARSGFQLGQAEHEIQGRLVPADHGSALYHQFDRRRRADNHPVELNKNDSGLECINKTAQLYDNVIARTKNNISLAQYDEIIDVLNKCEAIDIIATDMNANIAHYAQHVLMPIGKPVHVYENQDLQIHASLNVPSTHVVILVTKTGFKRHILDNARILCRRGIRTIAITPDDKGTISKCVTYTIKAESNETLVKLRDVIFSISTKFIFDLFFTSLCAINYENTLNSDEFYNKTVG